MLKKIYMELCMIRQELQAIRKSLEFGRSISFANGNSNDLVKEDIQKIKMKCVMPGM